MTLSDEQIDAIYKELLAKMKSRILAIYGTMGRFAEVSGIGRTSLVKQFTDNIKQDMSIGMYFRLMVALKIIDKSAVSPAQFDSLIRVKEYLQINNNHVMHSLTLVANGLGLPEPEAEEQPVEPLEA